MGTAPLFAVCFAVVLLDEPLAAGIAVGVALIVAGGVLLAGERDRPEHVKVVGFAFALGSALVLRRARHVCPLASVDTSAPPPLAMTATFAAGALTC